MTVEIEQNNERKPIRVLSPKDSIRMILIGDPYEVNRVASLLEAAGISTIGQLCRQDRYGLLRIGKIGEISIERIIHALSLYGYSLEMTKDVLDEIEVAGGSCNHQDLLNTFCKDFKINLRSDEHVANESSKEDAPIPQDDEEQAYYDALVYHLAQEEFLRTNHVCDLKVRATRAIAAAHTFVSEFKKYMDSTCNDEE